MMVTRLLLLFLGGVDIDLFVAPAEVAVIVCGGCIDLVLLALLFDTEESDSLEEEGTEEEDDDEEDPDDEDEETDQDDDEEENESFLPAAPNGDCIGDAGANGGG